MVKKYKGYIIFYYISFLIALAVASFYDLSIDKALNNPEDPFSIWFYLSGEFPAKIIMPLAGMFIYYFGEKRISKIIGLVFTLGGGAFVGGYLGNYIFRGDSLHYAMSLLFGLGIGIFLLIMGSYITIPEKIKKGVVIAGYVGIAATLCELAVIETVKIFWGRVRFRDLIADGSFGRFTPWYHPNGHNGNKSFPSGHTGGAGISYLFMLVPFISEKLKDKFALCFAVPFVYTSIVAYTRLVMGAHYLSDVAVGGTISFTIVLLAMAVFDSKSKNALENHS